MMKITIIAGARPNFMKIAPIIKAITRNNLISYRLVHTGQHYDKNLSENFFRELEIPQPDINLKVGSGSQAEQTAKIMIEFEKELLENPCDYVLLVGDVNSTLACAIVAKKLHTKVIHVEAGLRSNDMRMPEEVNRKVVDSISDLHFTTTTEASEQLYKEGHGKENVHFVGNVMIDSLVHNLSRIKEPGFQLPQSYFALTLHRPSNVDKNEKIREYLEVIHEAVKDKVTVVFPIHPRTKKSLEGYVIPSSIKTCDPLSYHQFLYLIKHSIGVITDSGGIQEETTFMNVPCITLRENTERPETITIGTNELVGDNTELLKKYISKILEGKWKKGVVPDKWDGNASIRIIDSLIS